MHNSPRQFSLVFMRLLLGCCFWMIRAVSSAQNLVSNGSMEDENICTEYIKNCAPEGWIISSLHSNFYFDDPAEAYHGQHFRGLVEGGNGRYGSRNFISSQLLCGLRKDSSYQVTLFFRSGFTPSDSSGIHFSADNLLYRKWGSKDVRPQLWIADGLAVTGSGLWSRYTATYKASGDEAFLNIAVYKTAPVVIRPRSAAAPEFSFFIDSVAVIPVNKAEKLCVESAAIKEALYEADARHTVLEKQIYPRQRMPQVNVHLPRTIIQRIDTLVIPDVFFATNSYALTAPAVVLLDSLMADIRLQQVDSLVIEGHTDNKGTVPFNEKLSQNRAASVAFQLTQSFADRTTAVFTRGWAAQKPRSSNSTSAGRQKNRRVEIFIYKQD